MSLCHIRYNSRFFEGDQLQAAMQAGQDAERMEMSGFKDLRLKKKTIWWDDINSDG